MKPSETMVKFLLCFQDRCAVLAASNVVFGSDKTPDYRNPQIPELAIAASDAGWLVDFYGTEPIPKQDSVTKSGTPLVFFMELELTDAGLVACGLPPRPKPSPASVVLDSKPKAGRSSKKPVVATRGLFDDDD